MKRISASLSSAQLFSFFGIGILLFLWQPSDGAASELLILTSPEAEARNLVLQESIDAQLMDYDAMSELIVISNLDSYDESAVAEAKKIQQRTGKIAFLWLNDSHFFLYVHVDSDTHLFTRPLPQNIDSWEVQCDAIASNVQAMLSPWFASPHEVPPPKLSVEPEPAGKKEVKKEPVSTDNGSSLRPVLSRRIRPGFGVAYITALMSTNNLWSNGATTLFNLKLRSRVILSTGLGFAVDNTRTFRMLRFPVRFRMEVFWKSTSFSLGIGTSLLIDAVRLSSNEYDALENTGNVYLGVGASLAVMYQVSLIFSIVLRGGVDLYQSSDIYWYNDDIIFYYGHLQGRTLAGIIFWLR